MDIEIQTTNSKLIFDLFDNSKSVSQGDKIEIPGNATLELKEMTIFKSVSAPEILNFSLNFGINVVAGLVASWLYDKLKNTGVEKLTIENENVSVNKEEIQKVLETRPTSN